MFYNTTNLTGDLLEEAERLTAKQDKEIYQFFLNNPSKYLSSHDVEDYLKKYPRSSIVRSMNTLTNAGLIFKTEKQVIGKYGKLVYTWKLRTGKPENLSLF